MKTRILHCIGSLGGGGAERQLAYLGPELIRLGWQVDVAFVRPGSNLRRLTEGGVGVHWLSRSIGYDPRLLQDMRDLIRRVNPDLIQTWLPQMDVFGGLAARVAGVPWVLSERCSAAAYPLTPKHLLRRFLASGADAVVANSACGRGYWATKMHDPTGQYVVPNGLPLEEIAYAHPVSLADSNLPPHDHLLLNVGRHCAQKNLEPLLLAIRQIPSNVRLHAVFCGEGPSRARLEKLIQYYGLGERVTMLGYVSTVWQWMKRANVFVSLSSFEGHPNAVMEAMACGCPIVASDIPAHREMLDEETGLLVDPHSTTAVAEAIQQVLAAPAEAARRARNAQQRVKEWSVANVARKYEQVYQDVLARRRSRVA